MKILLINHSLTGNLAAGISTIKVPLGLAYIAGYLEKHGFEVEIIDCLAYYENIKEISKGIFKIGMSDEELAEKIKKINPDIVGISCAYTSYEKDSFRTAEIVKKVCPKSLVVFGGAHCSANPASVLKNKNVDTVCIGEGEITFLNIVKNYKKKLKKINGVGYRDKGKIRINPIREYIENLDDIPFPARHLLPMERYLNHPQNSIANMRSPTTEIISSRGCPFNCIFCSIHTVWGRKWRARSAKNVVDEIEMLFKKYGIREFRFFDDNLSWDKKRMIEICDEIMKRKLDIRWDTPNGVAISTLNEEVLKKMKQAGYYKAIFGIESGNEESLKRIRKPLSLKYAKKIVNIANKLGIWTWSTFVIGFPWETREDIEKTIGFIKNSDLDFITVYIAQPYPGTEMHKLYEKEGLLEKGVDMQSTLVNTKYDTKYFKAEELRDLQKRVYREFFKSKMISYINPITFYTKFLRKIRNFEDLGYIIRMFLNLMGKEYSSIYKK